MSNSAYNPAAYAVGGNFFHSDETVTGSVDGSNTSFTTSSPYLAGTLEVFINGLRQARTTHVSETTPASGVFTLDTAPQTGDIVRVNYQTTTATSFAADTVDGYHASTIYQAIPYGVAGNTRTYTANDTWAKPANLKYVIVEVQGGGGGGGGAAASGGGAAAQAGGGGSGGYSYKKILAASLGSTETVTIGAAGSAGTAGNNAGGAGGNSSFGAHATANGGSGGSGMIAESGNRVTSGGAGGTAASGDINIAGEAGTFGRVSSGWANQDGGGGGSRFGNGGRNNTGGAATGSAGTGYGAGGSGGYDQAVSVNRAGGAGTAGIVIVYEYF